MTSNAIRALKNDCVVSVSQPTPFFDALTNFLSSRSGSIIGYTPKS